MRKPRIKKSVSKVAEKRKFPAYTEDAFKYIPKYFELNESFIKFVPTSYLLGKREVIA